STADSATANSNNVMPGQQHQIGGFQNISYSYVGDSYVAQIAQSNTSTIYTPGYDALGRCVKRSMTVGASTTTTFFVYDGEKPVLEYNSAGGIAAKNVYGKGIDEILMRTDGSGNGYYYQQDHEGSVTHLINASNGLVEFYRYD